MNYYFVFSVPKPTFAYAIVCLVTIFNQFKRNTRYCRYARQGDNALIMVFAICNGTAERMLFLASYYISKATAAMATSSIVLQMIFGFLGFSIYSALIHDLFWLKAVFAPHIKPDATPFLSHGLLFLMITSAAWFYIYEVHGDVLSVVIFHVIFDAMVGHSMAFPTALSRVKER
jgi:hypothetical protein